MVQTWARRHPVEHDQVLAPLLGATALDRSAVLTVIGRKFNAIGYAEVPTDSQNRRTWLPCLRACPDVQTRTGEPLRDVDRALHAAKGNGRLPVV